MNVSNSKQDIFRDLIRLHILHHASKGGVFGFWFIETWFRTVWTTLAVGQGAWVALPFVSAYSIAMLTESITLTWHDMRWVLFVMVAVKLALGADQPERWARLSSARP